MKRLVLRILILSFLLITVAACGSNSNAAGKSKLILGAYSTPRESYAQIIPLFQKYWKDKENTDVEFQQSYGGSGSQSNAIIKGLEADIAALSVTPDIDAIAKADLINHDWTKAPNSGFVYTSVVAFAVRKGNPKGIKDWADLAKPGIEILTPDAKSSGGAQWNILALYGAALRGHVEGVAANDTKAAFEFLKAILKNVKVFDKDARTSITNFESGIGDVAITYESEVLVGQKAGKGEELIIPTSTILIENPISVVDKYVDKHGTRKVAEAFISFLQTTEAQRIFAYFFFFMNCPEREDYPKVTKSFFDSG
jgi:sulfate/thiosulfate-binding protein